MSCALKIMLIHTFQVVFAISELSIGKLVLCPDGQAKEASVVQVKLWHRDHRIPTIQGLMKEGLCAGIIGGLPVEGNIKKRLEVDHVDRHGVCPLADRTCCTRCILECPG
jgi:hypothetical protein